MTTEGTSVAPFYNGWRFAQDRLAQRIGELSLEQLQLRAAPHLWPIWAIAAHSAGARVYWLCQVFKEPGAERTPFNDPNGEGWEDDLAHLRAASDVVAALQSTWTIVEDCLTRWTPAMLQDEFHREREGQIQIHTRQGVLMRLLTHDAYHIGEINQTLGMHGLKDMYIWTSRLVTVGSLAGGREKEREGRDSNPGSGNTRSSA
jgi:uncharacterized damage-inducible protein DinB